MRGRVYTRRSGARFVKKVEQSETQRFVTWVKRCFPHVIIYCDAMGEDLTDSGRMRVYGMRNINVPDIIIDYASKGFHGARFEHKKAGTRIYLKDGVTLRKTPYTHYFKNGKIKRGDHLLEQAISLQRLRDAGYHAEFTTGLDDLQKQFLWYMGIEQIELDLESPF